MFTDETIMFGICFKTICDMWGNVGKEEREVSEVKDMVTILPSLPTAV